MYVTPYGNPGICVKIIGFLSLNDFIMIVRFYKYDFWIPEQILDLKNFVPEKIFFLEMKNIFRKSAEKIFF